MRCWKTSLAETSTQFLDSATSGFNMQLWHLMCSASDGPVHSEDWLDSLRKSLVCSLCHSFFPGTKGCDGYLRFDWKITGPINAFGLPALGVIRKDFLESLGQDVRESLYLGKLFLPNGREHQKFLTFRGKEFLHLRGKEMTDQNTCWQCGDIDFFPHRLFFVREFDLKSVPAYEDSFNQLTVTDEVIRRLMGKEWQYQDEVLFEDDVRRILKKKWKYLDVELVEVLSDEEAARYPVNVIPPVPPDPRIIGEVDRHRRVTWVPPPRHE